MRTTRNVFCELAIPTALISFIICGCAPAIPPELIELGAKKGEGLYEKRLLIDLQEVLPPCENTRVQDIRRINDSDEIAVLTSCAVIHIDLNSGAITLQRTLDPICHPAEFVDIESDGSLAVFCSHWHPSGFALVDAEGGILWLRDDETPLNVSNFEDLDDDGSLDFCARFDQSLACFNLGTGDELWRETGTQYANSGSRLTIVEDESTYVLTSVCTFLDDRFLCGNTIGWTEFRNGQGTLIGQTPSNCDEAIDELCRLTRRRFQDGAVQLIPGPPLTLLDSDNRLLTEPQTPPSDWQQFVIDVAVLPSVGGRAQIGMIWALGPPVFRQWGRRLLAIHDGGGDVVYEEVFDSTLDRFWTLDEGSSPGESQPFLLTTNLHASSPRPASELYLYQPTASGDRNSLIFK